jgi:hypothetical protein
MGRQGVLNRVGWMGAWSLLAGALAVELFQTRRLRRRVEELSSEVAAGGIAAEAVPETRFEDRDEAHQSGARYD